jgi:type III secretory pathway component EscT
MWRAVAVLADLQGLGLAWARVSPTLAIVPAFGLRALPIPARGILGIALAASIAPAIAPIGPKANAPWVLLALEQIVLGLPIALATAIPLWAATMAGGLADTLRGTQEGTGLAVVETPKAGPIAILLSLLASYIFLASGGPSRVASQLSTATLHEAPLAAAAHAIVSGVTLALAIAGPLLAAAIVLEVAFALIARAASPSHVHALLAPIRALSLLAILALVLERIAALIALAVA